MDTRMPAVFVGHGNPMNALATNSYTRAWAAIGAGLPRPKAILAISAHWYVPYCAVSAQQFPPTIHDFSGFPKELYAIEYPAPGSPELAERIRDLLGSERVRMDSGWGIDHGSWAVLLHVFPEADIPVLQLSIDRNQPADFHLQLGRKLSLLRDEGVLLFASGNIVHNLFEYAWGDDAAPAYEWAERFEGQMRQALLAGNAEQLVNYQSLGRDARLAVPTPDHYLPLLYIVGAQKAGEKISFPVEGIDGGSISMLAVQIG